jgi:hypothetical protein
VHLNDNIWYLQLTMTLELFPVAGCLVLLEGVKLDEGSALLDGVFSGLLEGLEGNLGVDPPSAVRRISPREHLGALGRRTR